MDWTRGDYSRKGYSQWTPPSWEFNNTAMGSPPPWSIPISRKISQDDAFSPYPAQSYYSSDDKSGKAFQSYPHPSYHFDGGKAGKALPRPDRSTVHASWPQRDFYLEESQKWNALRRQTRPILSPSPPPCPRPRPVSSSPGFPTGYTLSAWEPEGQNHVLLGTPAIDDYAEKKPRTLRKHASGKYLPMIVNGREIGDARHDTGAERGNFIDKTLADSLNLQIQPGRSGCKSFSLGNGKVVRSIGKVKAMCAFAKETQTRVKCWFYVLNKLAAPLIMGSEFLEKTKTMSTFTNRLETRHLDGMAMPMLNFIGFTHASKRRFAASIDGRQTYINADSGSDLDFMSSAYVRAHGYKIDRRMECRKRIQVADGSVVTSIGQVRATLTLANGSCYVRLFDVLPELTSDVLLGEISLEEIEAFTVHESSFVEVLAGERNNELCTLGYLGKVNDFLVHHLRRSKRGWVQEPPSLAKQQDDLIMEKLYTQDLEARRFQLTNLPNGNGQRQRQDTSHVPLPRQNATASSTP